MYPTFSIPSMMLTNGGSSGTIRTTLKMISFFYHQKEVFEVLRAGVIEADFPLASCILLQANAPGTLLVTLPKKKGKIKLR